MNLVQYVPKRDVLGRFKPSRKKVIKFLFVVLALVSFYTNYWQAKQAYNFKCAEGGYFTTKVECNEIAQNKFDAREYYRINFVKANEDIFNDTAYQE